MSTFVSGGRNPNIEPCCDSPRCEFLSPYRNHDGGWCTLIDNRVPSSPGWPVGFMPSVSSTGGCGHHSSIDPQPVGHPEAQSLPEDARC